MRPCTRHISLLLLLACDKPVDIGDDPIVEDQACLQASAEGVDLVVDVPGEDVATIGISNRCADRAVQIYDVTLDDPAGLWTVDDLQLPMTLDPNAALDVALTFATSRGVVSDASLTLVTDDTIQPNLQIPLHAVGDAPRITLSPSGLVELGELPIGCESGWDLELRNDGGAPLTVNNAGLAFLRRLGVGAIDGPELPWVIQPGDSQEVSVSMHATAEGPDKAYALFDNDDPNDPSVVALASFEGTTYQRDTSGTRWTGNQVDILVGLDRTDDAHGQQEALLRWLPAVASRAAARGLDMHIGVISAEDGCVLFGPRWTDETNTTTTELLAMADLNGSYAAIGDSEGALLQRMVRATTPKARAGCNAGLLRPGARTHMILMSDRADGDNDLWKERLQSMRSTRPHVDDVVVHALVGGRGCGRASEGLRSIAEATSGALAQACGDFTELARPLDSAINTPILPRLHLTGPAVTGSMDVQVDFVEAEKHNWRLLAEPPAVLFTDMTVKPGSILKATYDLVPPEELCAR